MITGKICLPACLAFGVFVVSFWKLPFHWSVWTMNNCPRLFNYLIENNFLVEQTFVYFYCKVNKKKTEPHLLCRYIKKLLLKCVKGVNTDIWSRTVGLLSHTYPVKELPHVKYLKHNENQLLVPFFITLPAFCILLRMTRLPHLLIVTTVRIHH